MNGGSRRGETLVSPRRFCGFSIAHVTSGATEGQPVRASRIIAGGQMPGGIRGADDGEWRAFSVVHARRRKEWP